MSFRNLPSITEWDINDYIKKNNAKKVRIGFSYNSGKEYINS